MPDDENDLRTCLAPLMRSGIYIPLSGPCTLRHFLESTLGLSREYVEERIQIILLNGLPVDELDIPISRQMRLALSAAMQGYGSAVLRRNSALKCLRNDIQPETESCEDNSTSGPFWIELRLYNDIAVEQCITLFKRGFAVSSAKLHATVRALARPLSNDFPPLSDEVEAIWLQMN